MRTPICDPTCTGACSTCDPQPRHNPSVPPTSRITVARAPFPGLRFCVHFPGIERRRIHRRLAKGGWRTAWTLLEARNDAPPTAGRRTRRPEDLERHLRESLERAGVPDRLGVFLDEYEAGPETARPLSPAAILAVLSRRSGRLYLPSRRLEPSLADPRGPQVLFFPEEDR